MMMDLHRYDIVEVEKQNAKGSVQGKKRPYVIVSNEKGTINADIVTVMPLTSRVKKRHLPVHECLEAQTENGLAVYSMILGEQPQTICKSEILKKIGTITNKKQKNMVNKVCYYSFFYGEKIDWNEVLA